MQMEMEKVSGDSCHLTITESNTFQTGGELELTSSWI
jgi:hypothetical protein